MNKVTNGKIAMIMLLNAWLLIACGCGRGKSETAGGGTDTGSGNTVLIQPAELIPALRKKTSPDPICQYREKTDNPLNDWYFSVALFETPRTFDYLLKMQFEEVTGQDTIRLPNFGFLPQPSIQKGKDKYSCIIGFMDANHQFREYKLVHVVGGRELKLTTLKRYSVATYTK